MFSYFKHNAIHDKTHSTLSARCQPGIHINLTVGLNFLEFYFVANIHFYKSYNNFKIYHTYRYVFHNDSGTHKGTFSVCILCYVAFTISHYFL